LFEKVLIANRGEIALRVARACRELGIQCVAVFSTADAESAVVKFADEAVQIGPPAVARSYLHIPSIIGAALKTGADAIHPGYGFLSEDPYFAEICSDEGITFIGPKPDVMEKVGDKATARQLMSAAGLPLLPGTVEPVNTLDEAHDVAGEIGYPVIIKAVAGGGGRGMSVVNRADQLASLYQTTRATAQAVFKDSAVYIERYLETSRHTEIQLVCDSHGSGVYFGERDCSVQRRHQKLIEEAPSIHLSEETRREVGEAAVRGALSVGYTGAGTMEFLLDLDGNLYFMEMNARIQVEHPVTEEICGLDLVAGQIALAEGGPLPLAQEEVTVTGHAIECRICAEDGHGRPAPGTVTRAVFPAGPGIRVDTWIQAGSVVPYFYDSLLAKLIVTGAGRAAAVRRLRRALAACEIDGVAANLPLLAGLAGDPGFAAGGADTGFWARVTGHAAVAAHG